MSDSFECLLACNMLGRGSVLSVGILISELVVAC